MSNLILAEIASLKHLIPFVIAEYSYNPNSLLQFATGFNLYGILYTWNFLEIRAGSNL